MNSGRHNTILSVLQQVHQKIDVLDAELLIAHVLKKPREWVLMHHEFKIEDLRLKIIKKLFARRAKCEPLAYLTGHKEFFGLDFVVNKHVLIPRPETEILVEDVIKTLANLRTCKLAHHLIDIGTGSGCIPISIANHIRKSGLSVYPYIKTFATDISVKALRVARQNARKHGVSIKFLQGDLLEPFFKTYNLKHITHNLIITANLPYLTKKQYNNSPTIKHEPKLALVAKKHGLEFYERLLKQIKRVASYKLQVTSFLEIDHGQSKKITQIIKQLLPHANVQIKKDLAGLDRVVIIKVNDLQPQSRSSQA